MKKLTQKESLFCLYYCKLRNAVEAASRAGYRDPFRKGTSLLRRKDILSHISQIEKDDTVSAEEIVSGYRRIAFGSCRDALKLLLYGELPDDGELDCVDLFNVSEIKKPKDGAIEIKFFDRLKALEHLEALSGALSDNDSALTFYEALRESARTDRYTDESVKGET